LADVAVGGEDDDGDFGDFGAFLLFGAEEPAVHDGHHEVEEDEVWRFGGVELVEGFLAVACGDDVVAFFFEDLGDCVADVWVVLDDEDDAFGLLGGHVWAPRGCPARMQAGDSIELGSVSPRSMAWFGGALSLDGEGAFDVRWGVA